MKDGRSPSRRDGPPMRILWSIAGILGIVAALVAALMRVFGDLMERGPHAAPSDLDLPRDLDHIVRREVETVDQFHGIPVKKSEHRHSPTADRRSHGFTHD